MSEPIYVNLFDGKPKEGDARLEIDIMGNSLNIGREIKTSSTEYGWQNRDEVDYLFEGSELQYLPRLIEVLGEIEGGLYVASHEVMLAKGIQVKETFKRNAKENPDENN